MRRSLSVKATYDGVVRLPISLAMISTLRAYVRTYLSRQSFVHSSDLIHSLGFRFPRFRRLFREICAFPSSSRVVRASHTPSSSPRTRRPPTTQNSPDASSPVSPRLVPRARDDHRHHPPSASSRLHRAAAREKRITIIIARMNRRRRRTDRVARHRRTNTSCRDRSRSRDLQPYSCLLLLLLRVVECRHDRRRASSSSTRRFEGAKG